MLALWCLASGAQIITEIADATGDGTGNVLDRTFGIALDGSGNVYVSGETSDNVFKIDAPGTCSTSGTTCTISEIMDSAGDGAGNLLDLPFCVAVDLSGNVYVAGKGSDNVFRIAAPGTCSTDGIPCTITEIIDATGDGAGNPLNDPQCVVADASGNVFVTGETSDNVFKIEAPGTCSTGGAPCSITEIIDATGDGGGHLLDLPIGVATDGAGNVYVAASRSDNAFKIDTPGTCSTGGTPCIITEIIDAMGDSAGNPLDATYGIALDGSGNVYVTGELSTNVFRITPGGVITEILDSLGDGMTGLLDDPQDITTDGSGNVYVGGEVSNNAFKINTPGTCSTSGTPCVITEFIDATGDGAGNPLGLPYGIAVDASGDVYLTGLGSDNAFKVPEELTPVELLGFGIE